MTKLITDKIPVLITKPIGEPPRGYQFLDVWPYKLYVTVSGPEEVIKRLKAKEQRITFNLNDISKSQLDDISFKSDNHSDVVSFFVPSEWKQISFSTLSEHPIEINDPQAAALRIDFLQRNLLPIETPIPFSLFFPQKTLSSFSPENTHLAPSPLLSFSKGVALLARPLYASGVDSLFLEVVKDFLEIVILIEPHSERNLLTWSTQFINSRLLEDQYVTTLMSDVSDRDIRLMSPSLLEEYLRNRFRSYMNHFQLLYADSSRFDVSISLKNGQIYLQEIGSPHASL